jgi:23S rRNA (uracil1939-C5)-methyltransferase
MPRHRRKASAPKFSAAPFEVEIGSIGAQGDGVAAHERGKLFVPYTTAGDRVRVQRVTADRAMVVDWLAHGPHRQAPSCPHFGPGKCGGCALQHLDDGAYVDWKTGLVRDAIARAGFPDAALAPLARTPPGARRRAEFVAMTGRDVAVGFHVRSSHDVVAVGPCPVLTPRLEALPATIRTFLTGRAGLPRSVDVLATDLDGAVELVFTAAMEPDRALREALAAFAAAADLARIAWRTSKAGTAETIVQRRPMRATFGAVPVDVPAGAFLQASAAGEQAIVAAVSAAIGPARRVADLYAGCGAISLAIAAGRHVHAVEVSREMSAALDAAARRAGLGPRVRSETRDLDRRPLLPEELAGFDAVIFDPPREGAAAQATTLAAANVPVVAAVSCNPATFARDAQLLARGGYRLVRVTPIDQFLWSPHLELVGEFRR